MRTISFELLGIPMAKQSFRKGRIITGKDGKNFQVNYKDKQITEKEKDYRYQIMEQLPKDFVPFSKWVIIESLEFLFPIRKSESKKNLAIIKDFDNIDASLFVPAIPMNVIFKTTKPDTDNLEKLLWDAMNGKVFIDDSLICLKRNVLKRWSSKPRTLITLTGE